MRVQEMADEKRISLLVRLPLDLALRMRRLIFWTGQGRTGQGLLVQGLEELLDRIEAEENKGKPYPRTTTEPEEK